MASKLKNMEVKEGSLVGAGANQEANLILFKSDDDEDVEKVGRKISAKRLDVLARFKEWFKSSPIADLENMMEDAVPTETQKGDLSMTDETKTEDTSADVEALNKRISDLEAENADLKKEEPEEDAEEDIFKDSPEAIQKFVADMKETVSKSEERAKRAEEKADALKETATVQEFADKAGTMKHLGKSQDEVAAILRKSYEVSDDHGKMTEDTLRQANDNVAQSDLFKELGGDGEPVGDAEGELDKLAKAYADKHDVTIEKALVHVIETPEGRTLYKQHSEVN